MKENGSQVGWANVVCIGIDIISGKYRGVLAFWWATTLPPYLALL